MEFICFKVMPIKNTDTLKFGKNVFVLMDFIPFLLLSKEKPLKKTKHLYSFSVYRISDDSIINLFDQYSSRRI